MREGEGVCGAGDEGGGEEASTHEGQSPAVMYQVVAVGKAPYRASVVREVMFCAA